MERRTYDRMRDLQRSHWWFAARRQFLAGVIGRLALPLNARVLEVGCGPGGNIEMLQRFGTVVAVEPDPISRHYASETFRVPVLDGSLPYGLPDELCDVDLLASFDVVEHVEDDAAAVRVMAERLRPGGWFVATVPANAWMWSEHDVAHHHQRRYDRDEFRGLLEYAGLQVRRVTYFNTLLFPPIAAVRLAKKALGLGGDDEGMPPPPVNGVLQTVFGFERALLDRFDLPFGVSLLAVGRKPRVRPA